MKRCGTCQTEKPLDEFPTNNTKPDGKQSYCKACKKIYQAGWYKKNKKTHRANVAQRNKEHYLATRQFLWDYLIEHPCIDCGEPDPVVLQFDHVRGTKSLGIAQAVKAKWSIDRIQKEIEKCEVRCANCHARRTAKQFNWYECLRS